MQGGQLVAGQGAAVIFDFYGTLSDPHAEVDRAAAYAETGRALGVAGNDFWHAMWATFAQRAVGELGGTRASLAHIARDCGADPTEDQLDRALAHHLATAAVLRSPRVGSLEVLDVLLAGGLRLGLLSDCSSELPEAWETTAFATRIESAVFSWSLGIRKPDPRTFLAVTVGLGVEPSECWYVGDGGSREIWGASRVGMTTVLVRNTAYGVDHLRIDADSQRPAYAVDDLDEVPALVLGPRGALP